jgi:polysaccharide biosynthesis PFTS motif protein
MIFLSLIKKICFHNDSNFKGYRNIIKNNKIYKIDKLKQILLSTNLIKKKKNYNFFFFLKNFDLDLTYRQYLYSRLVYYGLNKKIIFSLNNKKNFYILPDPWLKVLRLNKINLNYLYSKLAWYLFAFKNLLVAQVFYLKTFFSFLVDRERINYNSYFFIDPPSVDISSKNSDEINFFSFFIKEFETSNIKKKKIYHNNKYYKKKIIYNSCDISKIKKINKIFSFFDLAKFSFFFFYCSLISLILLPIRQEFSILLKEVLEAYIFYLNKKNYSKIYLFNNGGGIYRPIWTYVKKERFFKCFFLFDSMYCNPLDFDDDKLKKFNLYFASNHTGYEVINWDFFYFWNKYQKNFFKNKLVYKNFTYKILKPINIGGLKYNHKKSKDFKIIFFDIPPFDSNYALYRHPPLFYNLNNLKKVFEDICDISKKLDFRIFYKFKRYVPGQHDKKYFFWIENFVKKQPNVSFVSNDISVSSILKDADLVIGMPFTAAAIIAKEYRVDSIYYDISNIKYEMKLAYDEILIIKNKDNLKKFLKEKINNKYKK